MAIQWCIDTSSPFISLVNLFHDKPIDGRAIQFLDSWVPSYPIGARYKYSNLGFVLVGRAAVTLGGKVYTKLLNPVN